MSIASPITLDDVAGNAKSFQRLSTTAAGSDWIRTDTNLTEPVKMAIKHTVSGSGANAVDRHLIQVTLVKVDAAGIPRTVVVNLTIQRPRSASVSDTNVKDAVAHVANLITDNQLSAGITATTNLADLFIGVM